MPRTPNAPDDVITVNGSTIPATGAALLRYVLTMLGTFAVARGWVKPEDIGGIVTILATLATAAYGLWRTHSKQDQLITTAGAAPNSVAKVV